ncbi:hypothetical protein C0Q70_06968 [Pomacea canaliculata]|uniref:Hemimethylated DNA-binding domain-containing protein n=2 Tax=Pomacea canaliculata TaxID=400727 RepID=A0A2T7PDQ6_POMCA|nr:hypothetical protein C0Q70_06968 [Pomacea canaliculata]
MFVLDELHLILFAGDSNAHLTERYYAEKAFYNLQHAALRSEIRQFLNLPPESQKIEIGAMMVSRWFQPGLAVSHDIVCKQLDDIADRVRKQLRQMLPDVHPASEKSYLEAGLTESLWTPTQCRQVLEAINIVLYQHMGFAPSETTSYMACNSYLDKVLEKKMGFPITLCILYSAVARRLGVVCELVNFPAYFLLRWKENPMAPTEGQYTFIDAYGHGQMLSHKECLEFLGQFGTDAVVATALYAATTTAKVLEIMARNLVRIARCLNHHGRDRTQMLRFAIGLHLAISPDDAEMQLMQVRLFLHLNINLKDAIENLRQVAAVDDVVSFLTKEIYTLMKENETRDNERHMVQEKLRKDNAEVHFSVGMVMKHKKYHYTCVIYGWDKEGRISEEWITQEGVGNLQGRPFQPFYNVLAEDGSNRYAAQENLVYAKDVKAITHPEVGKYFEKFTGKFYVPNKMKQEEYPDDAEMTGRLVTQYFLSTK